MKGGRSSVHRTPQGHHHHPPASAADDWGEESWTVDCICGVTFDDGEEMVNCDDCGVWVHTRCSRYVKGEELFTCDKCKKRQNSVFRDTHVANFGISNDSSEETEVAQLLVELPTKTVRLENGGSGGGVAVRRPCRLWTDIPMEEKVHVQGVPGGDPAFFAGFGSGVFTPALWKCSGYIPKKFNFRYREFPCWDEEEGGGREGGGGLNEGDKGAGVLFSLSKGNGVRGRDGDGIKRAREWGPEVRGLKFGVKKERTLLHPLVVQSGKRKKEDAGAGNDRSSRKKARAADRDVFLDKRGSSTLRTAFASTSEPPKISERLDDRGPRSCKSDSQTSKAKNLRDPVISRVGLDSQGTSSKVKDELDQIESALEALSADLLRPDLSDGSEQKEVEKATDDTKAAAELPTTGEISAPAPEQCDVLASVNQEGENLPNNNLGRDVDALAANDVKPVVQYLDTSVSEAKSNLVSSPNQMKGSGETLPPSGQPNVKLEVDINNCRGSLDVQSSEADVEDGGMRYSKVAPDTRAGVSPLGGLPSEYHVLQDTDKPSERRGSYLKKKGDESSSDPCHAGKRQENLRELTPTPKEQSKARSSTSKHKTDFQDETSSSSLIGAAITKSSPSDSLRSGDTANTRANLKQHAVLESTVKKYSSKSSVIQDVDRTGKEHQRSSVPAAPKAPNSSKVGHGFLLRRTVSDSKDSLLSPSSKASPVPNSSEAAESQQREYSSNMQNKATVRGDKCNLSNAQLPLKSNQVPLAHPSAPTGILSDEELALLLHQQLNSSPRVPRVPRVRQTGSLPQSASPTAASMLLKRSSSAGGKDHGSFSRRKSKDVSKDAFRHSHEPDDGAKRASNRGPPSPDLRRQDSGNPSTGRGDGGFLAGASSVKNNIPQTSTSTANSGPSSSTEVNDNHLSSIRNSPSVGSDEDTGTARGPVHRTLPGLINDIMSKGRRMTYEELCNAVLPHWHNLRKHNGERYAYSSPSQAVLDCLRNRQEWAQLVDRGPKTNANRKKRKVDAEESDDNGYSKERTSKDGEGKSLESQREDFPKGKRKARKRKLALQGRGLKDSKKRRKSGSISDDDSAEYSDASEKSQSSEDEIREGGAASDESEPSACFEEDCET